MSSPDPPPRELPLELDGEQMRGLLSRLLDRLIPHVESLAAQPAAYAPDGLPSPDSVRLPFREEGSDLDPLLRLLFEVAVPASFNTAGPGYLAYIPGGGIFTAGLAGFLADVVNRYVGVWAAAPLLADIEAQVVRWLARLMGLPAGARGTLTTGGSMANFTALVTARHERLPEDFLGGVIYASDQVHHSVTKAARLAGFPSRSLVTLPCDGQQRIRLDALRERIAADRRDGRVPFLVVASAGTTNTGAVDDLPGLAALARREGLWLHVDAAYGGFFRLTARGREALTGIEQADSIVLDPHKGLFLPYGCGALVVRDGLALRRAHATQADYMPPLQDGDRIDPCEHSMELSRGFRGLRVWLPLQLHGVRAFRDALEEKLDLARYAAGRLRSFEGIEIVAEPQLSILAFRLRRPGLDEAALEALNRRLLDRVLDARRVWLTPTRLAGRFVIRIAVLHYRTHRDRVDECLELIRKGSSQV